MVLAGGHGAGEAPREIVRGNDEGHRVGVLFRHRCGDVARADGRHAHARSAQLHAQAFEVADGGRFRGAVGAGAGQAAITGHARHADQLAAPGPAHSRDEGVEGVHHPDHVGVEDFLEDRDVVRMVGRGAVRDAGVGDDQVGHAMLRHEVGGRCLQGAGIANVGNVGIGPRRQSSAEGFEEIAAAGEEPQPGALAGVVARERLADAAGGARQEDDHAKKRGQARISREFRAWPLFLLDGYFLAAGAGAAPPMSLRAIAMRFSSTGTTLVAPPAWPADVTYLPFTTSIGTPSTL